MGSWQRTRQRAVPSALVLLWLATASCAASPDRGKRIAIGAHASAEVPSEWAASDSRGWTSLRAPEGESRIDLQAVPKRDYGVVRDTARLIAAVRTQASAMAAFADTGTGQAQTVGGRPAAYLDWRYSTPDGREMARRHWVIELENAAVHVSCTGAGAEARVPSDCDAVARSVAETPASLAGRAQ